MTEMTKKTRKNASKQPLVEQPREALNDFEALGSFAFDRQDWHAQFRDGVGLAASTMIRYAAGRLAIPEWVLAMLEALCTLRRAGVALPTRFSTVPRGRGAPPGVKKLR